MKASTTLEEHRTKFQTWLKTLGYSVSIQKKHPLYLSYFFTYLAEKYNINQLEDIKHHHILSFQSQLERRTNKVRGGGLSSVYIQGHLIAIKQFNHYLKKLGYPHFQQEELNTTRGIPTTITPLSQVQIQQLYTATDQSPNGYRQRALLSLYYGCGLRISEGIRLQLPDLHYEKDLLYVKAGKTNKGRYVPMTANVKQDLKDYQSYARAYYLKTTTQESQEETKSFLLNNSGTTMQKATIQTQLKRIAQQADLQQRLYAHLLRHSIATHLLQAGMDIESIGKFLGHGSLGATEIYTHIKHESSTA